MRQLFLVPCPLAIAIEPEDIVLDRNCPLMGTLGEVELEALATIFILNSQTNKEWMGLSYLARHEEGTFISKMVGLGYLTETQIGTGWVYALTVKAVVRIFRIQMLVQNRYLQKSLELAQQQTGIGNWLRRIFSSGPRVLRA